MSYNNPYLLNKLQVELQQRICGLPIVETMTMKAEDETSSAVECLLIRPKSMTEISRGVRAARTMRLGVRAHGRGSSTTAGLIGDPYTLIVDCNSLEDCPRMELTVINLSEQIEIQCLRVMAGVGLEELVKFQIANGIEFAQPIDVHLGNRGTVIGTLFSLFPISNKDSANQVFAKIKIYRVRIIDSRGELKEYSSDEEIALCQSSIGMLGVIYDVFLEYFPISITRLSNICHTWKDLLSTDILYETIEEASFVEMVYIPYNSYRRESESDLGEKSEWHYQSDKVLVYQGQTAKRRIVDCDPVNSSFRTQINVLDPVMGPKLCAFVDEPRGIPNLLSRAFSVMHQSANRLNNLRIYTPWAMNILKMADAPLNTLRMEMSTDKQLDDFKEGMKTILETLPKIDDTNAKYPLDHCIQVRFTGNQNPHNMEISALSKRRPYVVCLTGLRFRSTVNCWQDFVTKIISNLREKTYVRPVSLAEVFYDRWLLSNFLQTGLEGIKEKWQALIEEADRDGMFSTESLRQIFFTYYGGYHDAYNISRKDMFELMTQMY